jgi:glucosamine-6-phosphate deaminase
VEVIIRSDADSAATLVARLIVSRLQAKPDLVLGLATGRTMERVYENLAASSLLEMGSHDLLLLHHTAPPT